MDVTLSGVTQDDDQGSDDVHRLYPFRLGPRLGSAARDG